MTNGELLQLWRAGDDDSGRMLTARLYPEIYRFFEQKVDPESVEDLAQSVFVVLCEKVQGNISLGNIRPYVFGIARNLLLNHYRKKAQRLARFDPLEHSVADSNLDISITSALTTKRTLAQFYNHVRTLPLDTQLLIEFKHYHEFTEAELSEIFGISILALRNRIHRARSWLRTKLSEVQERLAPVGCEDDVERHFQALRTLAPHRAGALR